MNATSRCWACSAFADTWASRAWIGWRVNLLNESQARWYVAREALARGRGGLKAMFELTGMSRPTILKGIRELEQQEELPRERVRQLGGGRKRLEESDPGLQTALNRIMGSRSSV